MTKSSGMSIMDKQEFINDAISDMQKNNANFCTGIGKLTKLFVAFGADRMPYTPVTLVPKILIKHIGSDIAGQYAEKLCNTFTKNLDSGKYCPVPLTQNQKDIAINLLNGKADENYLKMCKPEDVKLAAKSVEAFTESKEYRSVTRQAENKITKAVNSDDFVVPGKEMAKFEAGLDLYTIKDQINSIEAKQATTFLTELNTHLPSMLPMVIARLANFFGVFIFTGLIYGEVMANDRKTCTFVREMYALQADVAHDKQINVQNYKPINLMASNYNNTRVYFNQISVDYMYDCFMYYSNSKILGIDCHSSEYMEDTTPADLKDLLKQNMVLRYAGDCVGRLHNEPGNPTKEIIQNCFTEVKNQKPQKNDLIIKNCNVKIVN